MKQLICVCSFIILQLTGYSQVGVGTDTPDASALLDVSGTTGGFLPPRLSYAQMNAIVSPAEGLMVYCTDCDPKGMYYFDGMAFLNIRTGLISGFETVITVTGRVWLDRNLGATSVATSSSDTASYGDLYQWGRATDGHQLRDSESTTVQSSTDVPGHADFILNSSDWRNPQNNNLWQGVDEQNNPCPEGYRVPTKAEWDTEIATWSTGNAFTSSTLRLPLAGLRAGYNGIGDLQGMGISGLYWSSTVDDNDLVYSLGFGGIINPNGEVFTIAPSAGLSIRCIKD